MNLTTLVRAALLCAPALLVAACAPPPPSTVVVGVTADQAMERANAAYALAQQAEADAQAARVAASTMYNRSLHK
jgi:hypothetical protein